MTATVGAAAPEALAEAGITPVVLGVKEGLALINGTDGILGMLVLALHDARALLRTLDVAAAMSVEALLGTDRAFADDLHVLQAAPGETGEWRELAPLARMARRSWRRTARTILACRTRTRCAARPRFTERRATQSPTPRPLPSTSSRQPSTIPWSSRTDESSPAATFTVHRSATHATCSRLPSPTSAR